MQIRLVKNSRNCLKSEKFQNRRDNSIKSPTFSNVCNSSARSANCNHYCIATAPSFAKLSFEFLTLLLHKLFEEIKVCLFSDIFFPDQVQVQMDLGMTRFCTHKSFCSTLPSHYSTFRRDTFIIIHTTSHLQITTSHLVTVEICINEVGICMNEVEQSRH